ncbi:hypothetical protein ABT150_30160 [Streptomyces mirabilis]|uniref:hypothetical protein n=1 Tax=Streptomyces mirabilis TaxID=68239 RepID=UPI003325E8CD
MESVIEGVAVGLIHAIFEILKSTGESLDPVGVYLVVVLHPFILGLDALDWCARGWRYVTSRTRQTRPNDSHVGVPARRPDVVASPQRQHEVHVIRDQLGEPYLLLVVTSQLIYVIYVQR